jgi:hypothetical protein
VDGLTNVAVNTTTPITVSNSTGYYLNNYTGAITYNLPATATGKSFCFRNAVTRTGIITIKAPASTYIDKDGALGTVSGTAVSGGALGDSACVVGYDSTHYMLFVNRGTWTNN